MLTGCGIFAIKCKHRCVLETENKYEGNNFSQLLWKEIDRVSHGASASFLFKQYTREQRTLTTVGDLLLL